MLRKGFLLTMVLLVIAAHWVAEGPHASLAAGPGAQSLEGEEAVRFLKENGLLESVMGGIPPQGRPFMQVQKVTGSDGAAGDGFGNSVALAGDTALVGVDEASVGGNDYQGAAYVFVRNGTEWSQQTKLTAGDGTAQDYFGKSVALAGDTALVAGSGAAYVFVRSGTEWSQQAKLTPEEGGCGSVALAGDTALLGASKAAYVFVRSGTEWSQQAKLTAEDGCCGSVALAGDTALLGAPGADVGGNDWQGAAYVFVRNGTQWSQQAKLTAEDGGVMEYFGNSVALVGDTALVGAYWASWGDSSWQGAAYVFVRSGTEWSQQAKLTAADGASDNEFGVAVALAEDTALVGAFFAGVAGEFHQGAAYVFTRSGTEWSQQAKLTAGDGATYDVFGTSVALAGDMALVGASQAGVDGNVGQGAAYLFERSTVQWLDSGAMVASEGATGDRFGYSVALAGDTALVGAHGAAVGGKDEQGAAYVFTRAVNNWLWQATLTAEQGAAYDWFGYSVALAGDTALVGASAADVDGKDDQGAAYVFTRSGTEWSQQARLTAGDGAAYNYFGTSVALAGDTALVGATWANVDGNVAQGAAYVFARSGTEWSQQAKLAAEHGVALDYLGSSAALAGDTALVGASGAGVDGNDRQGAAYVFVRSGTDWSQQAKLTAEDGAAEDWFGTSVALAGDTALVGASGAGVDGNDWQGAAYVLVRSGTEWSQQAKLTALDGAAGDHFGESVALAGDTALVGASRADVSGKGDQGAAYAFARSGTEWSWQTKLAAGDGVGEDYFGRAVALAGDTALVGAYGVDVGWKDEQGKAYTFTRIPPEADLGLVQSDSPDPVAAGATLIYTLSITNAGPHAAYSVSVTDSLPSGVAFSSATGSGWACSEASGEVVCTTSSLAVGPAPDILVTVTAPGSAGTITNNAAVTSNTHDPNNADNTAIGTTTVNPPVAPGHKVYLPLVVKNK